jgi:hypothetical protein
MRRQLLNTTVMTDYGQFDLVWGEGYGFEGDWDAYFANQANGLVGVGPEGVYVSLARRSGGSLVTIAVHDEIPHEPPTVWEDVVEVSATVPAGASVRWQSWAGEASGELAIPSGDYRIRVSARGRDQARADEWADGVVDHYEIDLWPDSPGPDAILRVGSDDAAMRHREFGGHR